MSEPLFVPQKDDDRPWDLWKQSFDEPVLPEFDHSDQVMQFLDGEYKDIDHPMNRLTDKDLVFNNRTIVQITNLKTLRDRTWLDDKGPGGSYWCSVGIGHKG